MRTRGVISMRRTFYSVSFRALSGASPEIEFRECAALLLPPTLLSQTKKGDAAMVDEIKSVGEYLSAILPYQQRALAQIHRFGHDRPALLFRGKKEKKLLRATIAEKVKGVSCPIAFERERLSFLKRRLAINGSDWDIVAIAQHHSIATRFLDWTSNSLTALWFALGRPEGQYTKTGASEVWLLETTESDFDIPDEEKSPVPDHKGSKTVIFTPNLIDCRMSAQDSYLMRQVYEHLEPDNKKLGIRPADENPTFAGRLHKIRITNNSTVRMLLLNELATYGYDKSHILPDSNDSRIGGWDQIRTECDNLAKYFNFNKED